MAFFSIPKGEIRKVVFGENPMDGLAFSVSEKVNKAGVCVTRILRDADHLEETGKEKIIIVARNREGIEFVWKEMVGLNYSLEYLDPKGEPINII